MTTISTMNPANSQAQISSASTMNIGKEFNSFIKLLTAQVRYQDPLSPMDSTQFVEQLATFSSLEQLVNSNTALNSIASMIGNLNALMASEWIGQEVSFNSAWRPFTGEDARFSIDRPPEATSSALTVKDSSGNPVWTQPLDPGRSEFTWDGRLANGQTAEQDEMYEFVVSHFNGNTFLGNQSPSIIARVTELITNGGSLQLGTDAGLTADLTQVTKR